ncbi:hypothetical protein B5M47_01870 [candidate division CPR3 bacterium 4484_211]|uniref:Uncharacterized protein n=1 Tax=candidate division CPR3 bacterium 4484_211 TaxID=1968527 RepID=A0A1W9NY63_UNCC3|nr:MAG: hypothetical protein B5M47_01870 [candidate division CPR3 bacterium 4484_211]
MLKNLPETIDAQEPKEGPEEIIYDSLTQELHAMEERNPGRDDIKFRVLKQFIHDLAAGQPFDVVFGKLDEPYKHAIITRLQNRADHMGGKIPHDFIEKLEKELYGIVLTEDGDKINFDRKVELEKQLQSEN